MTTVRNHWEPCSPQWLAAMPEGACSWAPRRAGDGQTVSHYHPALPAPPAEQTETARALLWRHGLPEDVIDGALCLHAQELAAAIRAETESLKAHGVLEPDKYRPCRDAANQIDPTAPDDTDLSEADIDRMMAAGVPVQIVTAPPAALAAMLPPPVSRAAIRAEAFREAAVATRRGAFADTFDRMADDELRSLADEAQPGTEATS